MDYEDQITLRVGGITLSGWTEVSVTRGIEVLPSTFELYLARDASNSSALNTITDGRCELYIGSDRVLTGWVDRPGEYVDSGKHIVRVSGRSLCADIVDCSADIATWGGTANNMTLRSLAERLLQPHGISVVDEVQDDKVLNAFSVSVPETAWDILERVARYRGVLLYDNTDGNLVIARGGGEGGYRMSSGFREGVNVKEFSYDRTMDQRYSEYIVLWQTALTTQDRGATLQRAISRDTGVKRYRPLILFSEQRVDGQDVAQRMADWAMNRRKGRSECVKITTTSWRDASGRLWQPNAMVSFHLPTASLLDKQWLISSVSYHRSVERGTVADLVIMPPEAFQIAPYSLNPYAADRAMAVEASRNGGTVPTP